MPRYDPTGHLLITNSVEEAFVNYDDDRELTKYVWEHWGRLLSEFGSEIAWSEPDLPTAIKRLHAEFGK